MVSADLREFWKYRDKLSIVDGVLLCDGAVVVPTKLRQAVLDILGSAHQGVQAMRDRAADTVFWPTISEVFQNMSSNRTVSALQERV